MEDSIEDNIESKEDKDALKKDLEIQKLQKELKKLDLESTELKWRRFSAWGPTVIAIITIGVTAFITYNTQIFDVTSKEIATRNNLVQYQTLQLNDRKHALTISNNKLRRDSIQRVKELKEIKNQISSLSKNFKNEETRYKNLLVKREYLIKKLGVMTDSLGKEIVKAEDCYSKAKELLMICVQNVYDSQSNEYVYMESYVRKKYPLKTRLRKSDTEIAEMELSNTNAIQFLTEIAFFEVKKELNQDKGLISTSLVSKDGAINILTSSLRPGNMKKTEIHNANYRRDKQFECWKSLSKNQKLKLLREIKIRE